MFQPPTLIPVAPGTLDLHNPNRRPFFRDDVERALELVAEHVGNGQFQVTGGKETHYLSLVPYFECDCRVFLYPGDRISPEEYDWYQAHDLKVPPVVCKHLIAALLLLEDEEATRIAHEILAERDRVAAEAPAPDGAPAGAHGTASREAAGRRTRRNAPRTASAA